MKRLLLLISFFTITLNTTAQFSKNKEKQIVIGTVDSLFSNTLNEQREIWVHVPENMNANEKYPVIYLLDGTSQFYTATGILKRLEKWNMPKSIIVGIANTDRTRDFTTSKVVYQRGRSSPTSGGAANFLLFIKNELQPYLENKYPIDDMSTIIGHSTGGLLVLYTYINHPDFFDNYLAIDPSLWWDKEKLVEQSKELLNTTNRKNKYLNVAVANSTGIDTVSIRKMTSEPTEMLRANLKFHDLLVKHSDHLNFTWNYYKNEDHGSVVVPGMYDGLRALFSWYPFPERWRYNTPKSYTAKELTEPFYIHFEELSKRFKRDVKPDWQFINDVGFHILSAHNAPKRAKAYLEMIIKFYPKESRSYVAMGKFHVITKNKKEAIANFEKAIKIDGNVNARIKLAALNKSN